MESYEVYWKGKLIGEIAEAAPDMWYVEGTWCPAQQSDALEFSARAGGLDSRRVTKDPSTGMRAQVRSKDPGASEIVDVLVLSLAGGRLLIRRVFDAKAVRWLRENVSE